MINILFSCIVREYVEQEYINRKVKCCDGYKKLGKTPFLLRMFMFTVIFH